MGTIANAKVTHYYNCYNGDFIGCLRPNRIWRDKIWHRTETYNGQKIEIWGM